MRPLIVDALASGKGSRVATRDVIGAGPRAIAGVLEAGVQRPKLAPVAAVLEEHVDLREYDALLVSGMTSDLTAIRRTVSRWKKGSEGPVLIGGPVTSEPERALRKTKADIAVVGEAELTLNELLELGLSQGDSPSENDLKSVRGIAYRGEEGIVFTGLRPVMERSIYDSFDPSTEIIADYPLYMSARVYVEVLRGCSNYHRTTLSSQHTCSGCDLCQEGSLEERYYCPDGIPPGCGYCSVPSLYGPPRSRSVNRVVNEIQGLLDRGVTRLVLSAPGFLDYGRDLLVEPQPLTDPRHPEPNYEAIEVLFSGLRELDAIAQGKASLMIENIKGSLVTERAAKVLGLYLGGTPVNIGFETGSAEHSLRLGRSSTPSENLTAIRRLRRAGMKPYAYFIHGLPGQTSATASETVKTIDSSVGAGASRIILYRFQSLPMSAFQNEPGAPPASRDPQSKRVQDAARRANRRLKEDLLGTEIDVVIAEPYDRDRRFHVTYPMLHGPVVLVEGVEGRAGDVFRVVVEEVVSDRIVKGRPVDAMF
ncbi:hypothetical protein ES703_28361 [subsurface metagenome]